jgi:glycerophosphoryl diester phosphodiesterase
VTFVVAHRAGNSLARLQDAERLGVALIEADIRLWRGRPEVRHLKTVGPLPILWDTWLLANPFAPRLQLHDLLGAARRETQLLLDLKGRNRRLAELVRDALPRDRRVAVCARSRWLLEPFADLEHVRRFQSIGSRRQLRTLLRSADGVVLDGVSIHERLLDERVVEALRDRAATVISWPVNTLERARELARLGIQGLISDDPAALLLGSS